MTEAVSFFAFSQTIIEAVISFSLLPKEIKIGIIILRSRLLTSFCFKKYNQLNLMQVLSCHKCHNNHHCKTSGVNTFSSKLFKTINLIKPRVFINAPIVKLSVPVLSNKFSG
jgi:hypothetical protein